MRGRELRERARKSGLFSPGCSETSCERAPRRPVVFEYSAEPVPGTAPNVARGLTALNMSYLTSSLYWDILRSDASAG